MRRATAILLLTTACTMTVTSARAQSLEGSRAAVVRPQTQFTDLSSLLSSVEADSSPAPLGGPPIKFPRAARPFAPIASALLPGTGQLILGQDRFIVYAAVEIISWWEYGKNRNERAQQEAAFKQIAASVARAPFTSSPRDTVWAYYEQMRDWTESGDFSKSSTGPIQPETDTTTYNGYHWQLALRNNPTLEGAMAEYERVAVRPGFQWSWKNERFQYDVFIRTTNKRNDANRAMVRDLAIIGANHVLSLVDAFASIRLELIPQAMNGRSGAQLRARIPWSP